MKFSIMIIPFLYLMYISRYKKLLNKQLWRFKKYKKHKRNLNYKNYNNNNNKYNNNKYYNNNQNNLLNNKIPFQNNYNLEYIERKRQKQKIFQLKIDKVIFLWRKYNFKIGKTSKSINNVIDKYYQRVLQITD